MRLLGILAFILFAPYFVSAQSLSGFGIGDTLSIESRPEYPAPGQEAELTLNDYSGGAYGAEITWYLNNTPVPGSQNARSIYVTAGAVGSKDVVKAVLTNNGISQTITRTINPHYLDIIIEPQTHVPGFFQGRPLASVGSEVRLTALFSDGQNVKTRDLVYLWKVNDTVLEGGPLRNRNVVSFTMPQDSSTLVSLQVSTPSGDLLAKRVIEVPMILPQVLFYEVNTLYGVESLTLKNEFTMIGDNTNIIAEPYYLDSNTFNYPNILEWRINGQVVSPGNNPYRITLQKTGYPGSATLDFHVRNTNLLLQGGKQQLNINI